MNGKTIGAFLALALFSAQGAYVCDKAIDTVGVDGAVVVREFHPDSTGGLFERGEAPRLKMTLKGRAATQVKVVCDLTDIALRAERDVASFMFDVPDGERTFDLVLPAPKQFGHYTVTAHFTDGAGADLGYSQSAFIVPAPEPVRRDPFFELDANNGQERLYPAGRRLGFGSIGEKMLSPQLVMVAPEDRLEAYLRGLEKGHRTGRLAREDFEVYMHLGPALDTDSYHPDFADLRLSAHARLTNRLTRAQYIVTDADLEKLRRFYTRAAAALRDRVKVWYLQSEIDSNGRRRKMNGQWVHQLSGYSLVARNMALAIRAGNPNATIAPLGICCGDYFWSPQPFLYSRMILDAMRGEFDAVSLDAYTGNYDPTHGPLTIPEESLAKLLTDGAALSAEYGGRREVWVAERGLGVDRYSAFDSEIDRRALAETARAMIIARAVPGCRSYSIHSPSGRGGIYAERANGGRPKPMNDMNLWRTTNVDVSPTNQTCEHHTPRAFTMAAGTCARMLAFAEESRTFALGDRIEVRSFRVPGASGAPVARFAVWTSGGALTAEVTLPKDGTFTDLAGNDSPLVEGKASLAISRQPFFLTFPLDARAAVEGALKGLAVVAREDATAGRTVYAEKGGFTAAPFELDVVNNIFPRTALMPEHGFFPMKEEPTAKLRFAYEDKGLAAEVTFAGETTHEDCEIGILRNDEVSAYYGAKRPPVKLALLKTNDVRVFRGKVTWEELGAKPESGARFWFTVRLPCRPSGHVGTPPFALVNAEPDNRFSKCATELVLR